MAIYLANSPTIEAFPWHKNGDHPQDASEPMTTDDGECFLTEGKIVRRYRHPLVNGTRVCPSCGSTMHNHGWIDSGGDGQIVCPGDYIIKTQDDYVPCHSEAFANLYKMVAA